MNKEQEKQIVDYYSTTDQYIRSETYSDADHIVLTKASDKFQWLVLESKSRDYMEVRQTDNHEKNQSMGSICTYKRTVGMCRDGAFM